MSSQHSGRNFDYPVPLHGRMAKQSLSAIEEDAKDLRSLLQDNDTIPQWVQYFIATSADRMNTITRYMKYDVQNRARSNPGTSTLAPVAFVELFHLGKRGLTNKSIGKVYFLSDSKGSLWYLPQLQLPSSVQIQPHHGFHIHNVPGNLDEFGTGAGPHFDPGHTHAHRGPAGEGHLGDLPPVAFDVSKRTSERKPVFIPRINVNQLMTLLGYPVVLHERGDNFSDMPNKDGGGKARLFGGFIRK